MQLLKSHLTKLAQGKEFFHTCTEAESPRPSFPGTRHPMGVVQTCCLSIQPETPFYSVSPAFSPRSLWTALNMMQTVGSRIQVCIQLSWNTVYLE